METLRNISKTGQLKEALLAEIRQGKYLPGSVLPSVRELMARYQVSKNTVSQALSILNELKIITVEHGKATRLRGNPFLSRIEIVFFGTEFIDTQPFWSEIYRGICDGLADAPEYFIAQTIFSAGFHGTLNGPPDFSRSKGIILLGSSYTPSYRELTSYRIPLLSIHDFNAASGVPFITADPTPALAELGRLFLKRGCRKVMLLHLEGEEHNDPIRNGINRKKFLIARKTLAGYGLLPNNSFIRPVSRHQDVQKAAYDAFRSALESGIHPDGILMTADVMASGVFRAAYELGINIPGECCAAGIDNLSSDLYLRPSLTSIDLNRREMGKLAIQSLLYAIQTGTPPESRTLPTTPILRESLC